MARIKELDRYQTGILLLLLVMAVVFFAVYCTVTSRVGFLYKDTVFLPGEDQGNTVYTGKLNGEEARFTVTPDKAVTFQWADRIYGPYTFVEDPTAVPKDKDYPMTGVEIRKGQEILFRGGIFTGSSGRLLLWEDGSMLHNLGISTSGGTVIDEGGNILDPLEPSVHTLLDLMEGPELTAKGYWLGWFGAVLISIFNAISILFADELFRFHLSFRVADAYGAEPSDWEIAGRYISWTLLTVTILVLYVVGLQ